MTFPEWKEYAHKLHARADRLSASILREARAECQAAGLDPTLLGIHPHNAMVSRSYGKPWPGVDYRKVRRTLWLTERANEPHRIVSRILDRVWPDVARGMGAAR